VIFKENQITRLGTKFLSFNLLHVGHVVMPEETKKKRNYSIVGKELDSSVDRFNKIFSSQYIIKRYIQLKGSKCENEYFPCFLEQNVEYRL
jgi:glycerol-3-phosphate cytidylyltransferase